MRALACIVLAACASSATVPGVRFANQPPITVVDDQRDVPRPPKPRTINWLLYQYDSMFHTRVTRALELPAPRRALGVNALDEVPDSTWFTNRIGVRDLSLDELRRGPIRDEGPERYKPWTILHAKTSGATPGFVIEDTRGVRYLLKFELRGYPELETATHMIAQRIMWAIGYNVPQDYIVYVRPAELVVAPGVDVDLPAQLALSEIEADGRLRALASRILDGTPLGGYPASGVRADDPNDRIPHERRRDIRGTFPMLAWIDHTDVKDDNTLDVWVSERGKRFVRHYLLDFGKSFGGMGTISEDKRRGYEYRFDLGAIGRSLVSLGTHERRWEDRYVPRIRGVGIYGADHYAPGEWKPIVPYAPFEQADASDHFWGAKLLMRFTPEQLRAIVELGQFTDPRAVDYLTATLIARQRATALHWFERTSPLDRFTVLDHALCFDDLTLEYRLRSSPTTYTVRTYDRQGRAIARPFSVRHPGDAVGTCMALQLAGAADGYTMFEIETARDGHAHAIFVHVARDPKTRVPRVIGVWRP